MHVPRRAGALLLPQDDHLGELVNAPPAQDMSQLRGFSALTTAFVWDMGYRICLNRESGFSPAIIRWYPRRCGAHP